ncbi:prolactin-releasing peptide receptor [Hermetia illucens]|uniref:prolactin-releasing peptide receptor n=1 Tax=Hermetia illucens TaxID=343691 RepID=UPI0018CC4289|nr:prolactin-releasing peptide receptor [Hermetia illucens]XP_037907078.1 prolactin-releasing peptide receptor [Hermetia illucens]XP_037907080.1 prolactin-releasing peptide receptor [Hermetia illucens]
MISGSSITNFTSYGGGILRNVNSTHYFIIDKEGGDGGDNHTEMDTSDVAEPDDVIQNEIVQIFFCVLYSTVFVLGVFGNVLVCYVVLRNKAMQTVTNIFITNLALSDILLCTLAVPFTPLYTFMGGWVFGRALCHLVPFAQGCSIYISTLTLTSIAIDRYFVIIYPFRPRMKLTTCIAIIVSIWVVSLLATLPYGLYVKVFSNATDGFENTYCEEDWPSEHYRKVFGSVTTILQFVLPFIIISICYTWVSCKLNARARLKPGSKNSKKEEADRDRKKRTNRMLISMVAVFGISWLPLNLVNIFNDFYARSNEWRFYTLLFFVAHSIAMSSTCYNPFLYAWLNENFRKEFKHVLPCFNPSNNNIINITRSCRSERNTCARHGDFENENILPHKHEIIPREPTFGKGRGVVITKKVDILLNDDPMRTSIDHIDEITVDNLQSETPFISSDNNVTTSTMVTDNHH